MKKIHIVISATQYEGSNAVAAYADKKQADKVAEAANKHEELRPRCPERIGDDPDNLKEWDKYDRDAVKWRKKHPADPGHDHHYVITIPLNT